MTLFFIRLKKIIKVIATAVTTAMLDMMIMFAAVVYGVTLLQDGNWKMFIFESIVAATMMIIIAVVLIKLLAPKIR